MWRRLSFIGAGIVLLVLFITIVRVHHRQRAHRESERASEREAERLNVYVATLHRAFAARRALGEDLVPDYWAVHLDGQDPPAEFIARLASSDTEIRAGGSFPWWSAIRESRDEGGQYINVKIHKWGRANDWVSVYVTSLNEAGGGQELYVLRRDGGKWAVVSVEFGRVY